MNINIARTISGKAGAAFAAGLSLLLLPAAALLAPAPVLGQETVYIGGSGRTSVEIDLGALDRYEAPRRVEFGLRRPGSVASDLAPVKLHPPGEAPASGAAAEATAPVEMVTKLEPPAAVPVTSAREETASAPEPMPAPEAKAEAKPAPEQMTEERAAAIERNKNSISSTAFANETARGAKAGNGAPTSAAAGAATAKAAPESVAEAEMAALGPADVPTRPGQVMQITFAMGEAALPDSARAPLAAIAAELKQDETLRLQLKAYAGGDDNSASRARRLSLSRALAVRSHLIEEGVRSTRIDVRALGNKSENGTSDRVDVILVKR